MTTTFRALALGFAVLALPAVASAQTLRLESAAEARMRRDHAVSVTGMYVASASFATVAGLGVVLIATASNDPRGPGPSFGIAALSIGGLAVPLFFTAVGMDIGAHVWSEAAPGREGGHARGNLSRAITITYGLSVLSVVAGGASMGIGFPTGNGLAAAAIGGSFLALGAVGIMVGWGLDVAAGRWAPAQWMVTPTDGGAFASLTQPF